MPTYYCITTALPVRVLADKRINSVSELASLLGLSRETVSRVLAGTQGPGRLFMERFLRAFPDCTQDEMFTERSPLERKRGA